MSITYKGKVMVLEFGQRALVSIAQMKDRLAKVDPQSIVQLERLPSNDDTLALTRANLLVAFHAMIHSLPMEALLLDDVGGLECKDIQEYTHTFYGYQCFDWIWTYLTVVSRREADLVASEFVLHGWIEHVQDKSDRNPSVRHDTNEPSFNRGRNAIYISHARVVPRSMRTYHIHNKDTNLMNEQGMPALQRRDSVVNGEIGNTRSFRSTRALTRQSFTMGLENDWQWSQLDHCRSGPTHVFPRVYEEQVLQGESQLSSRLSAAPKEEHRDPNANRSSPIATPCITSTSLLKRQWNSILNTACVTTLSGTSRAPFRS